jgi:hypothetical protein
VDPRRRPLGTIPPGRTRPLAAILVLLAALAIPLAGAACGKDEEKTSGMEGEYINAGEALYQVQLSRLLGPEQRPDDDYLRGQPVLTAGQQYLGVFLTVENEGNRNYVPPRDMKVVDTQGNEYLPIDVSATGFGLSFSEPLKHGELAPQPDSPAASGPEGGALILFRISEGSATENLPLELEIPVPGGKESNIRLDL